MLPDFAAMGPLEPAWRRLLFNQFHDILPGSGVPETREYALGEFQKLLAAGQINANHAMGSLCSAIDTSGLKAAGGDGLSLGAGVGFGLEAVREKGSIGLENVRRRIARFPGSELRITSTVGMGTQAVLTYGKRGKNMENLSKST